MNHKTDLDTRQNYKNGWIQDKTIDLDMMRTSLVNDRCESALLGCRGLLPQKGVRLARRGAWIALRVCSTRGVIGSVWILCAPISLEHPWITLDPCSSDYSRVAARAALEEGWRNVSPSPLTLIWLRARMVHPWPFGSSLASDT